MIGKPGHLRQVAHGRLARIVLPVGVGRERGGRVERERGIDSREFLRVAWQEMLQAFDSIQNQHGNTAEHQHGDGVFRPRHVVFFVDLR